MWSKLVDNIPIAGEKGISVVLRHDPQAERDRVNKFTFFKYNSYIFKITHNFIDKTQNKK
ncbi:MAG: hypothetical protein LBR79_02665 [Oscillospiraceae bacterium]|nr:hypothetical protein [Oscillospiraceae bacterium]